MTKTSLHADIKEQIKDAMRAHEEIRLEVLRGLQAAFSNELIAKKSSDLLLKDDDVLTIIKKAVKQRKDSIEQFEKGGRKDLANKEKKELDILNKFLPETMSRADIKKVVSAKLKKDGPIDPKKIGQFMGSIMKELKGKAEGEDVKAVIDEMVK